MSHTEKVLTVLFSSALFLAACSAHVSSDSPTPTAPKNDFMDPRPTIQGPAVAGRWLSSCNVKPASSAYRQFDITFTAGSPGTVVRNEYDYTDSSCRTLATTVAYHGKFRFIDSYSSGNYNIEYAFDVGNGITSFPQEDLMVSNNQLFVSDFVAGSAAAVLKNEPLNAFGTAPTPGSTSVPAVQVSSYAAGKYAFCSTQGHGVMLDLTGVNLTQNGTGTAILGTKLCGSPNSITWSGQNVLASVAIVNGLPQVSFPNSTFSDYIRPNGPQSGLLGYAGAPALLNGNSGECFFLSNEGTQNLPFAFACQ